MSNLSAAPPEFDFWEFVNCARCQLPFFSPSGATIPFWLTECGHIVCNNHLNADQSCAVCTSPGIQLVPLQQEMDAPMADWFRSIPYALDSVAYAAKFQQESMAAQIRYYKARHQQQRAYIEKLKHEIIELRRSNQYLSQGVRFQEQQELQQEQQTQHDDTIQRRDFQEPSTSANVNGKRPMMEYQRPPTGSSPHSGFIPPIGPNRLTVPPGQQPQNLAANRTSDEQHQQRTHQISHQRPGSRSFQQQYAYLPPSTPHMPLPQVSHAQNRHNTQRTNTQQLSSTNSAAAMPPPPVPVSKFKPAQPSGNNRDQNRNVRQPPPPQNNGLHRLATNVASTSNHQGSLNRFLPPNERSALPSSVNKSDGGGRFVPPTPVGAPQRFITRSNSMVPTAQSQRPREPTRLGTGIPNTAPGGGQRMPFVPNGFG